MTLLYHLLPSLHKEDAPRLALQCAQALAQIASEVQQCFLAPKGNLSRELERAQFSHQSIEPPPTNLAARIWQRIGLEKLLSQKLLSQKLLQPNSAPTIRLIIWDPHLAVLLAPLAQKLGISWGYAALHVPHIAAIGKRRLLRALLQARVIFVPTEGLKQAWQEYDAVLGARANLLPPACDLALYHQDAVSEARFIKLAQDWRLPEDRPVILVPDAFGPEADTKLILDAVAAVKNSSDAGPVAVLLDQPERRAATQASIEAAIRARGLEGMVRIPDSALDWPAAYRLATVVLPAISPEQGLSLRLLEAQAMARPVIARAQGGMMNCVRHKETGWLIATPSSAAELADGLAASLKQDLATRRAMGSHAAGFAAQNFSPAAQKQQLMGGWSLLNERSYQQS